ncbi:MAG: NAD(P)H-dependent oxidoreductase [Silvanigrellales bacterium]|jgi:NAD(P)H-dependent FMN reductase|nr:NAD(P)H-dependent oxidoreductase [Silvanigrellales bacterium]
MTFLSFSGSLRKDSLNKKLARGIAARHGGAFLDLQPLSLPVFDGDIEAAGLPQGVNTLAARVAEASALVIAAPEYNGSISGVLKNALDWLSRVKTSPLSGKPVLLVGASPGALGAVRGLWHSRQPLDALGCHVFPNMMGISKSHEAFDTNDALLDAKLAQQLDALVSSFLEHASRTAR